MGLRLETATPEDAPALAALHAAVAKRLTRGIGRLCMAEAARLARSWPADAIRLDAYDAAAGAGGFYARCRYQEVGGVIYRGTPPVYYELRL